LPFVLAGLAESLAMDQATLADVLWKNSHECLHIAM
ncbi:MAG: TatD family deoxyribonuclease, partial [Acinetobacter sp.]|nr:TatD family deoxyribonuclease [Acinetobacter sp.]